MTLPHIALQASPKGYTRDLDKSVSPVDTVNSVLAKLESSGLDILRGTRRVDTGRLGIPVYLSLCGNDARRFMPTRKQMGKGSSPEQARASALMELMERYAFFSFWEQSPDFVSCTFSEARQRFGKDCIPIEEISRSVQETLEPRQVLKVMDCVHWKFYPATRLGDAKTIWLPLDWFRLLSEFNGTSSGNTPEESLLQGLSELVERHVCALVDRNHPVTATITPDSCAMDPVLGELLAAFARENVHLVLKDFSCGMPLPTVAALAWDPATFPASSEIVFTAGTASSPAKAAIRAVTEVAQLAGDFCTSACYEASGLPKFSKPEEFSWLLDGPEVALDSLPCCEAADFRDELLAAVRGLAPLNVYAVETTNRQLKVPAHYTIVPGLSFRERDKNQSVGLFVGRRVSEDQNTAQARRHLETIATVYPVAHFLPFFAGMLALREKRFEEARELFESSIERQPENDSQGLAAFYAGYAAFLEEDWKHAAPLLAKACALCPGMKEYFSYLGTTRFKLKEYAAASEAFQQVLNLDKGSVIDLANLGVCEERLGELAKAEEHLSRALELEPGLDFAKKTMEKIRSRTSHRKD